MNLRLFLACSVRYCLILLKFGLIFQLEFELAAKAAKFHLSRFAALLLLDLFELLARLKIDLLLSLHDPIEPIRDREVDEIVKRPRHDNQGEVHGDEYLRKRIASLPDRISLQSI